MKSLYIITKKPDDTEKDASLDEEWLIIDNLGEIESRTEKVLLAFLDQIPVRQSVFQLLDKGSYDCEMIMACVEHVCQILENVSKDYDSCGTVQERLAALLLFVYNTLVVYFLQRLLMFSFILANSQKLLETITI